MTTTLEDKLKRLSPRRRVKVERRAQQLVTEQMSLQQLRQAHKLTQVRVAKSLGIGQDSVARLERRSDILLSTLRHYIESMGGSLSLVAQFPDRDPVILSGIGDSDDPPSKSPSRT
jgi:DNA-binding XRE family transcriptional regulator